MTNPYEAYTSGTGAFRKFLFGTLNFILTAVLFVFGFVTAALNIVVNALNCGIEVFAIALMVWLTWNYGFAPASPNLASPISYLEAVALYTLFRIFFGRIFKVNLGEQLSEAEKALVSLYRETKGSPSAFLSALLGASLGGPVGPGRSEKADPNQTGHDPATCGSGRREGNQPGARAQRPMSTAP